MSAVLWTDLYELTVAACRRFGLVEPILEPMTRRRRCKMDGDCVRGPGRTPVVRLRLHRYHRPRQALARSTIMATLAHELAHLAAGCWNHGRAHDAMAQAIAAWLREQGQPVSSRIKQGSHPDTNRKKRRN
ncbi:MAG: hypothetical protein ACRDZ4_20975 [Egibacteraceae bacterium]